MNKVKRVRQKISITLSPAALSAISDNRSADLGRSAAIDRDVLMLSSLTKRGKQLFERRFDENERRWLASVVREVYVQPDRYVTPIIGALRAALASTALCEALPIGVADAIFEKLRKVEAVEFGWLAREHAEMWFVEDELSSEWLVPGFESMVHERETESALAAAMAAGGADQATIQALVGAISVQAVPIASQRRVVPTEGLKVFDVQVGDESFAVVHDGRRHMVTKNAEVAFDSADGLLEDYEYEHGPESADPNPEMVETARSSAERVKRGVFENEGDPLDYVVRVKGGEFLAEDWGWPYDADAEKLYGSWSLLEANASE